jgi:acyl carrier protein
MNGNLSPEERQMAQLIIESLNLQDTSPDDIDPEAPLFGTGLSLDSIDALELAVAIAGNYGVHLKAEDEETQRVFSSLRALTKHVEANKAS